MLPSLHRMSVEGASNASFALEVNASSDTTGNALAAADVWTTFQVQTEKIIRSCCEHLHQTCTKQAEALDLARDAAGYHAQLKQNRKAVVRRT